MLGILGLSKGERGGGAVDRIEQGKDGLYGNMFASYILPLRSLCICREYNQIHNCL